MAMELLESLNFFKNYLNDRYFFVKYRGKLSNSKPLTKGVPQGSILGPLLFSIYVNDLPMVVNQCRVALYADDTTIYVSSKFPSNIQAKLNNDLTSLYRWFSANRLKVNAEKTELIMITPSRKHDIYKDIKVALSGNILQPKEEVKILGVRVNEKLKWDSHTSNLINNLKYIYRGYNRSCRYLKEDTRKLLYNAAVASRLNYCDAVWDKCGSRNKQRLQTIQNRCIRKITNSRPGTSAAPLIKSMGWLNLETKRMLHKCVLFKKLLEDDGPPILKDMMSIFKTGGSRNTRLTSHGGFILPTFKTDHFKKSFFYDVIKVWNTLPIQIRDIRNIKTFKENLHKFFASDALDLLQPISRRR